MQIQRVFYFIKSEFQYYFPLKMLWKAYPPKEKSYYTTKIGSFADLIKIRAKPFSKTGFQGNIPIESLYAVR